MTKITVPLALIIFKRTDTLQKIANELNRHDITTLYLIADGPRNHDERQLTSEARKIAESISAQNVVKLYSEVNLGLKRNLTRGITTAMQMAEHLIVLEDDCLPSASFLESCENISGAWDSVDSLAGFCGSSFLPVKKNRKVWRSAKFNVWGWMAKSSAWMAFIESGFLEMSSKELASETSCLRRLPALAQWELRRIIRNLDSIDTWDVQFEIFCLQSNFEFLKPTANLVTNVGFDSEATNTVRIGASLSLQAANNSVSFSKLPDKRSLLLEWVEHSTKVLRLFIEILGHKLPIRVR